MRSVLEDDPGVARPGGGQPLPPPVNGRIEALEALAGHEGRPRHPPGRDVHLGYRLRVVGRGRAHLEAIGASHGLSR